MPEESKKRAATVDKPDDTLRASSLFDWRGRGGIALASGHVVSGGGGNEPSDSGSDVGGCQSSESDEDEDATTKLPGSGTDCTVIADFREGKSETYQMPSNVELLNTDHVQLDEQEDGAMALHLPDGAFLKLKLPKPVLRGWGGLGGWGNLGGWGKNIFTFVAFQGGLQKPSGKPYAIFIIFGKPSLTDMQYEYFLETQAAA